MLLSKPVELVVSSKHGRSPTLLSHILIAPLVSEAINLLMKIWRPINNKKLHYMNKIKNKETHKNHYQQIFFLRNTHSLGS